MKSIVTIIGGIALLLSVIVMGCSKDNANPTDKYNDLKGGTWLEYRRNDPAFIGTMKFRFYGDSTLTYTFISGYSPIRWDSIPNATWRSFQPDTIRFYRPTNGAVFGTVRVLQITDTVLYTKIQGYGDSTLFKRIN